jgi:hypothetical protein
MTQNLVQQLLQCFAALGEHSLTSVICKPVPQSFAPRNE